MESLRALPLPRLHLSAPGLSIHFFHPRCRSSLDTSIVCMNFCGRFLVAVMIMYNNSPPSFNYVNTDGLSMDKEVCPCGRMALQQ